MKMLLERADINPDCADTKYGRKPLWWAAERGPDGGSKDAFGKRGDQSGTGRHVIWPNANLVGCGEWARGGIKNAFGTSESQS